MTTTQNRLSNIIRETRLFSKYNRIIAFDFLIVFFLFQKKIYEENNLKIYCANNNFKRLIEKNNIDSNKTHTLTHPKKRTLPNSHFKASFY